MTSVGSIAESDGSIVAFAPVRPFSHLRSILVHEPATVESTDKVLSGRATEESAGVDVAGEQPSVTYSQQVGVFPNPAVIIVALAEVAFMRPVLQV